MSQAEVQAAWALGPQQGAIGIVTFTTDSSEHDLQAALGGVNPAGKFLTMIASANVYLAFSDGSAAAIDETNSTPGNAAVCYFLPAGVEKSWIPAGTHVTLKAPAEGGGNLRFFVGSP